MAKAIVEPNGLKICPVCKKQFFVQWQNLWAYKRRRSCSSHHDYYCSWKCIRALDKKGEESEVKRKVVTLEQKKKAVELAIAGEDPRKYLAECGSKAPQQMWSQIRQQLMDKDPDTYAKLPRVIGHKHVPKKKVETPEGTLADAMTGMKDAADQFFGLCEGQGWLKPETPEKPKINKPVNYDGMTVKAVSGDFGTYYLDNQTRSGVTYLDYSNKSGDELSMEINQWRSFLKELKHAGEILGVTL